MLRLALAIALALLTACGPRFEDADLTDPDVVRDLANSTSPPRLHLFAESMTTAFEDPLEDGTSCPSVEHDGDEIRVRGGGCTDDDGTTWYGSGTWTLAADGSVTAELRDFGASEELDCITTGTVVESFRYDGTITAEEGVFTLVLRAEGTEVDFDACTSEPVDVQVDYRGTVEAGADGSSSWSGSGTFATSTTGRVEAETVDEVIDDALCADEAASGTTTLRSGGDEVVLTYDGAVDCDPDSTVQWSLNGEAQGELTGVACATTSGGLLPGLTLGGLALLGLRRRRR